MMAQVLWQTRWQRVMHELAHTVHHDDPDPAVAWAAYMQAVVKEGGEDAHHEEDATWEAQARPDDLSDDETSSMPDLVDVHDLVDVPYYMNPAAIGNDGWGEDGRRVFTDWMDHVAPTPNPAVTEAWWQAVPLQRVATAAVITAEEAWADVGGTCVEPCPQGGARTSTRPPPLPDGWPLLTAAPTVNPPPSVPTVSPPTARWIDIWGPQLSQQVHRRAWLSYVLPELRREFGWRTGGDDPNPWRLLYFPTVLQQLRQQYRRRPIVTPMLALAHLHAEAPFATPTLPTSLVSPPITTHGLTLWPPHMPATPLYYTTPQEASQFFALPYAAEGVEGPNGPNGPPTLEEAVVPPPPPPPPPTPSPPIRPPSPPAESGIFSVLWRWL